MGAVPSLLVAAFAVVAVAAQALRVVTQLRVGTLGDRLGAPPALAEELGLLSQLFGGAAESRRSVVTLLLFRRGPRKEGLRLREDLRDLRDLFVRVFDFLQEEVRKAEEVPCQVDVLPVRCQQG